MNGLIQKYENVLKDKLSSLNVLVVGDVMVDEYVIGKVSRISPEAPIPVLNYKEEKRIAGGASNVSQNLALLGCNVTMAGVVGNDDAGIWLKHYLNSVNINTDGLFTDSDRPTTVKRRFATKSQQLLRVDLEETSDVSDVFRQNVIKLLKENLNYYNAVVLSDYTKGVFASPVFVADIINICNENNICISIDSKSCNIEAFKNATFVKPNNLELEQAVGIKITDDESLDRAGGTYLTRSGAKALIVTRGANGISVFDSERGRRDFPSKAVQVYDVTGAGDTVISTVTAGITCGLELDEAVVLGNLAASVVISKIGTASITAQELLGKIYDEENC
ncbi:bifunctional heptose 7-phosphate kinase/heptose 1-phosphate adenyltransferase [Anaerocolumna jejuensis]|uniref:bifunctional heptose 7-phosphate kinase/heptose 1-phosphate adenyltransferase n=1 Tax=Anaerocolumna jejuensis TaxID=259063 RepID=UPI003F7C4A85